ncbi:hypothetical protein FHS14_006394 [Paenibacillus baekrokdamisoli]|nr:hypothetical protein [Paenibacillus baekrokdamisoli]MBB3073355.1 hypothetical protein [Paenibacillus baekrokdamisoli]
MKPLFLPWLRRKFITAGITSCLFAALYSWLAPDPFHVYTYLTFGEHLHRTISMITIYLMYAAPAIYIYGLLTSFLTEILSHALTTNKWIRLAVSALFHSLFGLILWYISLLAAILFFLVDVCLSKFQKDYSITLVLCSLLLPSALWLTCLFYLHLWG